MNRVAIERKVLSENDQIAERLRTALKGTDTLSLNFIGSPGAGKQRFSNELWRAFRVTLGRRS